MSFAIDPSDTAVVFIDPQVDVLSPAGRNWELLADSITENRTVAHMVEIFTAAEVAGFPVFISPHYFYPTDRAWEFNGPLEAAELDSGTFARNGPLDLGDFTGSGADWLPEFKPYIDNGRTVVVSPHKVFRPQTNDLTVQLRKRHCQRIVLGGMLANMCVEPHLRDLVERGFEVGVVVDATAGPRHPQWKDGYQSALVNYRYPAHAVLTTADVVSMMQCRAVRGQQAEY